VLAELGILGIGQRFEGRGIPTSPLVGQQLLHSLEGNPGLARSGCGGNEHITLVDSEHGLSLEGVGNKGRSFGDADSLEQWLELAGGLRSKSGRMLLNDKFSFSYIYIKLILQ
jgi:hypothetical protein